MRRLLLALLVATLLIACPPPRSQSDGPVVILSEEYEPETTWQPVVTTEKAVRIRKGDIKLFPEENTKVAGSYFFLADPRSTPREIEREIAAAVARRGGTHYLVVVQKVLERTERRRDRDAEAWRAVGQAMRDAGCKDGQGNTRLTRECWASANTSPIYQERTIREVAIAVMVLAVRPKEWEELPAELQPQPMRSP